MIVQPLTVAATDHFGAGTTRDTRQRMCLPINDELTTVVIAKIESVLRNQTAIFFLVESKGSVNNLLVYS